MDPARPIIVYAMTFMHRLSAVSIRNAACRERTTDAILAAFGELAQRHPDWQFVLRPHPNEFGQIGDLRERATAAGIPVPVIDTTMSSAACVGAADVLVCVQSNLGIEAIIAGKPVVNVTLDAYGREAFDEGLGPLFAESDAALTVREVGDIAPSIESAVLDPATRATLRAKRLASVRRFNQFTDGKSTERVCSTILDMVANGDRYLRPVDRFPETEKALVESVPRSPGHVLVCGCAAHHVARLFQTLRGGQAPVIQRSLSLSGGPWGVIVLSDPVPHTGAAEALLLECSRRLAPGGAIVMSFLHSGTLEAIEAYRAQQWVPPRPGMAPACIMNGYSFKGIEILLARCRLEVVECFHVPTAALSPTFNEHVGQPEGVGSEICPLYRVQYSTLTARRLPNRP